MHRFIVGTGRCGSTLLSRMLAKNRETLSVFECFNGMDGGRRFQAEPMTGVEYADLITGEQPFLTWVYQRGYEAPEVLYPFDEAGARLTRQDPLPWILVAMLPRLTDRPHELAEEVLSFVGRQPSQPACAHHRALFDWLAQRFGKQVWVERSGASIDYLGALNEGFPRARFLHIHRSGEEAALSMREHHAFRLAIMLVFQIPAGVGRSQEDLDRLAGRGEARDEIAALLASRPSAEYFGRWWTDQVLRGYRALSGINADDYMELRFEDLIAQPEAMLGQVAHFLDLPNPDGEWRGEAAALVEGTPQTRVDELGAEEREALEVACRPGNLLLGR